MFLSLRPMIPRSCDLLVILIAEIRDRIWMHMVRALFRECGRNCFIGPGGVFQFDRIMLGLDVYMGTRARLSASQSDVQTGSKMMLGPDAIIVTGDHRTDVIGKPMRDVTEKLPKNDQDVVIEDDVWIGARVIILKGVRIGRGSIICASSIVVKSISPYSIYVGVPPARLWPRWTGHR